jgi:hypothetical protein
VTQNEPAEPAVWPPVPERPGTTTLEGSGTTGDPQVDAALGKLADLAELPLNEHPAMFEQIHGALAGALGTLDSGALDSGALDSGTGGSRMGDSGSGDPGV